jgi:ATP-dependent RNA helicase DHX37/DHR1
MLVFLTGQQEIQAVMAKLRNKIGGTGAANGTTRDQDDFDDEEGFGIGREQATDFLEEEMSNPDSDSDAEIKMDHETEFNVQPDPDQPQASKSATLKPYILPLYAALPQAQQFKVFHPPNPGTRLIVLATNVAETSLTIPGVRYVIDTGRAKEKHYNTQTGVQTFEVGLISKASAEQRKGRAGRTGSGHVWRLYSSNVYEEWFAEETVPEILRTGLESVVLQLKSMDIKNVATFPFPTAPDEVALKKAEMLLRHLGAVGENNITDIGRQIMRFPVNPRFGRILLLAQMNGVVPHAIALVAGLAVGDLFIPETHGNIKSTRQEESDSPSSSNGEERQSNRKDEIAANERHQAYTRAQAILSKWDDKSDAIKLLIAVLAHADPECNNGKCNTFCKDYWLREKGMTEVQLLRRQLHSIITNHSATNHPIPPFIETIPPPNEKQFSLLKQLVAAGFIDQVAIRSDLLPNFVSNFARKPSRAVEVAYRTLLTSTESKTADWNTLLPHEQEIHDSVFVHPSSVLARLSVPEMPPYLIYSHLSRAAVSTVGAGVKVKKTRFHPLTPISAKTLALLAEHTPLLQIGKPIGKIEDLPGSLEPVAKSGHDVLVPKRQCWVSVGLKAPGSEAQEWPLGAWKVVQRRVGGRWEVERVVAR